MQQLIILFFLVITYNGCSVIKENQDSYKIKYLHSTATTNFSSLTEDLLDDLHKVIGKLPKNKPITIVDFANIKDLENHSQLGFLLCEELKTNVTQEYNLMVNQIEFMRYLKIGGNGTKLLSRDFQDIKYEKLNTTGYALVGTYALTQRQLILYLKLVNLNNGVIVKSSTTKTTLTDEIIKLERKYKQDKKLIYKPFVL